MPKSRLKRALFTSIALGSMACTAAIAQSYSNSSGGTADFYGQLSPTYLGYDDGEKSYSDVADNSNLNSRVGFWLRQPAGTGELAFNFETGFGFPLTFQYGQDKDPLWDWQTVALRKIDLIYSGDFGKVSVGQGSMASDGIAGSDLSGTGIAGYVYKPDVAGGYLLRKRDGELSDISIDQIIYDFDGTRKARIRYDTPSFNGFTLAAAAGQEILFEDAGGDFSDEADYYDLGMFWSGESGDLKMEGAAGYAWRDENDGGTNEKYAGSFALLHTPTGLNGAIVAGSEEGGGTYGYVKAGWIGDIWQVGNTLLSADYYSGSDFVTSGSSTESWGLQAVQKFDDINMEAYIGYNNFAFEDSSGDSYQDGASTLFGFRWWF